MCAGGDLMEKTLTEATQLLQKYSRAAVVRRDWETRLAGEPEYNSRMKKCDEISKEATPKVTKEEPIPEKLEGEHIKSRITPRVDFVESNETNKRSMLSAKPLREFEQMDWVPIDYGEVFDKRRRFPNQKGMTRALERISHRKRKRKIHTTLKPPVRSFKSSLEMMKWIRNTLPRWKESWGSSSKHRHMLTSPKFTR
jgi:hypothetical protein